MSVIYRWRTLDRVNMIASERDLADVQGISSALARCEELGFGLRDRLSLLPSQTPLEVSPVRETAARVVNVVERDDHDTEQLDEGRLCGRQQPYAFDARKERSTRKVRQRLESARRMIDVEYFLEIDCRALADIAQMSRHHFIRMFRQLFGSTPHQYLIRTRVEAAKRLLLASREPIDVIATGVGFRSGQSLNRAFKQAEGVSVSRFCSVSAKHVPITRTPMPFRTGGPDHAHIGAGGAMTSITMTSAASGGCATSPTC